MPPSVPAPVTFTTADGVTLVGDLLAPADAFAAAVVCHPHPAYGGDRNNAVVVAVCTELARAGIASLRFDVRSDYGGGPTGLAGALADLDAALDVIAATCPGVPRYRIGYSFGAMVAAASAADGVAGNVAIAPPLAAMSAAVVPARVPTLVLIPAHDQFSPPAATAAVIAEWDDAAQRLVSVDTIEMADHFLAGRTAAVAVRTVDWIAAHCDR